MSSKLSSFNAPMALRIRISIRCGTNGAQWHNIVFERCKGAAQVLDCTGLNGGPCSPHVFNLTH